MHRRPPDYVAVSGDCDDLNPQVHPNASDESCDGLDENCDRTADEEFVASVTACGLGTCASTGSTSCVGGVLQDSCTPGQPSIEQCDGIDNNCNGLTDEGHVCYPMITSPSQSDLLDCRPGAPAPTITWLGGLYDRYRVFVSWDPAFPISERFSSGATLLKMTSWTVPAKKWTRACATALPFLYIKVFGVDRDAPRTDPNRKVYSDVVQVGTQR
jgi:hypothetical protein